jgi:predicted nucleic acid-binding protein
MNVYADTGFVVSLYKAETTSRTAAETMVHLQAPVWLSQLGELELHNAFQLAIFRGEIDSVSALQKKQLFAEDLANGVFTILPVPAASLYQKAIELAERHSATLGTRSLDLMHVAAALILKADLFLSFDERQRKAAEAEGIAIGP